MQAIPALLAVGGKVVSGIAKRKAGLANQRALYGQAQEEEAAAAAQELRIRDQARKAIGDQLAAQSSNGFLGGTGSALEALTESQVNMAMDALQVRRDAAMKARSYRAEGDQQASQGKFGLIEDLLGAGSAALGMKSDWAAAKAGSGKGDGKSSPKTKSPPPDTTITVTRGR